MLREIKRVLKDTTPRQWERHRRGMDTWPGIDPAELEAWARSRGLTG